MLDTILSNELIALFLVITAGLLLGRIQVAGLSLGSSGVIFTALALGHFCYAVPEAFGTFGLVLFVYCVGLNAGPGFFRVFVHEGKALAQLAFLLVLLSAVTAWAAAVLLRIPVDLAAGIFAGAMTSTPALAAALESLPESSELAVGYGIGYPFGMVGIILFVQLLPRVLRQDLDALAKEIATHSDAGRKIQRVLVEVVNPAIADNQLSDLGFIAEENCQVTRVLRGSRLVPVSEDFRLEVGQHVLLIGREADLPSIISLLGKRSERTDYTLDTERDRRQVVVTSKAIVGRRLGDLKLLATFGVTVARIQRHNVEFVPRPGDEIEHGDALSVVGEPRNLDRFSSFAGHRARTFHETDLISLGTGIVTGILLGMMSFDLAGESLSLGMAGGPLLVALVLGHFGRIGPIVGRLPQASQMLLLELGLALFLANAGAEAGGQLLAVLQRYGLTLCLASLVIVGTPLACGYLVAKRVFKMNLLQIVGGICGGMTSTPGLGVVTAKTDSTVPVVSYAAAYPVALILMTVFAPLLVSALD